MGSTKRVSLTGGAISVSDAFARVRRHVLHLVSVVAPRPRPQRSADPHQNRLEWNPEAVSGRVRKSPEPENTRHVSEPAAAEKVPFASKTIALPASVLSGPDPATKCSTKPSAGVTAMTIRVGMIPFPR